MRHFSHSLSYLLCVLVAVPTHAKSVNKGRLLSSIELKTEKLELTGTPSSSTSSNGASSNANDDLLKRLRALGSGLGLGGSSGNSGKSGSGSGAGAGSGGAGAGSGAGNNPPGGANQNPSGQNTADRGGEPPGGGGKSGDSGKPEIYDKFWPMCVLFDKSVPSETANEIVKGLHDKAAACKVNLYVEAVTVAPVPGEPDVFNPMSQATCNMGAIGFPTASVLLANPDQEAAAKMCGVYTGNPPKPDTAVAGCAR